MERWEIHHNKIWIHIQINELLANKTQEKGRGKRYNS